MSIYETLMSFPFSLQDQVILIVGAAAGLGWLLTQAFLLAKAKLLLADTKPFPAELLEKESPALRLIQIPEGPTAFDGLPEVIEKDFGRVDLVIHATEEDHPKGLHLIPSDEIERYVFENLTQAMKLTRAFLPSMLRQNHGTLAFVGSYVDGQMALPYYSVSAAARSGLAAFVESIHREIQGTALRIRYLSALPTDADTSLVSRELWRAIGLPQITVEDLLRALSEALRESKPIFRMFPHHIKSVPLLAAPSTKASHDLLLGRYDQEIKKIVEEAHAKESQEAKFISSSPSGSILLPLPAKTPLPLSHDPHDPHDPHGADPHADDEASSLSPQRKWTAIGLVAASFLLYGLLFAIPFVPLATQAKVVLFAILFIASEATFWIGGFLLGKPLLRRMRRYLNPLNWFPKNDPNSQPRR